MDLGARHLLQRLDERRRAQGHPFFLVDAPDGRERVRHLAVEPPVDVVLLPAEVLQVLDPVFVFWLFWLVVVWASRGVSDGREDDDCRSKNQKQKKENLFYSDPNTKKYQHCYT